MKNTFLQVSKAADLADRKERALYRFLEILPGFLSWFTLAAIIFFSRFWPTGIAFFIIAFDIYWLLKVFYLSLHLRVTFNKMQDYLKIDWLKKLNEENLPWRKIYHLILLPCYKEDYEVVAQTVKALRQANYPQEKMIVVLALEERAGQAAQAMAQKIKENFGSQFFKFLITVHPAGVEGELVGKGSNIAFAARQAKKLIDELEIIYDNIIVSAFDIDTRVYPEYFGCLTWHFLTCHKPNRSGFQPVPIYNNNIWQAHFFSRVVATSATFWHMMQQERPERLATFSSHAHSFKALVEADFWPVGNVSEDSRIFWKMLLCFDGDYRTVPLYYPVSMDANLAPTFLKTAFNVYKQQRRWGWGCENIPYFLYGGLKNKKLPRWIFRRFAFVQLEGFWSWGTNALIIFLLGWLPLFLGGQRFNVTVLAANLPYLTRTIMLLAMFGLISSAMYSLKLLPPRPAGFGKIKTLGIALQWIFLPVAILIFGALPGLEAQTRLMLGRYMGFWVTEKFRHPKSRKRVGKE